MTGGAIAPFASEANEEAAEVTSAVDEDDLLGSGGETGAPIILLV